MESSGKGLGSWFRAQMGADYGEAVAVYVVEVKPWVRRLRMGPESGQKIG